MFLKSILEGLLMYALTDIHVSMYATPGCQIRALVQIRAPPGKTLTFLIRALGPNKSPWLESQKFTGMNFLHIFLE